MSSKIVLRGTDGTVEGKKFFISLGQSVVIGRSSSCDICVGKHRAKTAKFVLDSLKDEGVHLQSVSRKHLKVCFYVENEVVVEDLSSNGTFVDGKSIDKITLTDFKDIPHVIKMGTEEFVLEWKPE